MSGIHAIMTCRITSPSLHRVSMSQHTGALQFSAQVYFVCHSIATNSLQLNSTDQACGRTSLGQQGLEQGKHLGRIDDGAEAVHVEHAQIGDGERAASELVWLQLVGSRLASQLPHLHIQHISCQHSWRAGRSAATVNIQALAMPHEQSTDRTMPSQMCWVVIVRLQSSA